MVRKQDTKKPVVPEHIIDTNVSKEMRTSYLEYAYSVIYSRALPDARDGIKPVQRRILFQMSQMGITPNHGHVKSSRVVGDVMGKIHPHGDAAIYDAMVRLAQPFNLRLPFIDGHGNFGSLDDGPAAPRYTEVRLSAPAMAMVADLDEDTVDTEPNYDNSLTQPSVLPAAIPSLLVNGTQGIAVGMATNMPPHNLVEVCAAARHILNHPQAEVDELMRFLPGPDLPEGGKIVGIEGIREAYRSGRGTFRTQASAHIENITARKKAIVVTELPYQVGPEKVIEKLKDAVQNGKVQGVSGVQNLTDRHHGLRIVIELKNGYNQEAVLAQIFKHTPLEDSFAINNVALVEGKPQTLGIRALLQVFLDHRQTVITRRCKYRLRKAQDRLHLVEGLLIAVLDIDKVIALIRQSEDAASAKQALKQHFQLSDLQAEHILQLRLRRLTKFSRLELEQESNSLKATIAELNEILASPARLSAVVSQELADVAKAFGTPRRTILLEQSQTTNSNDQTIETGNTLTPKAMPLKVSDDPCWVLLSSTGLIARTNTAEQPTRSGPRNLHDAINSMINTTARGQIGVVTNQGRLLRLQVIDLPTIPTDANAPSLAGGAPLTELIMLQKEERPLSIVSLTDESGPLTLVTASGKVKRVLPDYPERKDEFEVISLMPDDEVVAAMHASDDCELTFISSDAQLLHFGAHTVRPQGRAGQGIAGMNLRDRAKIIAAHAIQKSLISAALVVTVAGSSTALPGTGGSTIKLTPLDRYPSKGRSTGGVRCQRFLRFEDQLDYAWVGVDPRAVGAGGQPIDLPDIDERRDGSGSPLSTPLAFVG